MENAHTGNRREGSPRCGSSLPLHAHAVSAAWRRELATAAIAHGTDLAFRSSNYDFSIKQLRPFTIEQNQGEGTGKDSAASKNSEVHRDAKR